MDTRNIHGAFCKLSIRRRTNRFSVFHKDKYRQPGNADAAAVGPEQDEPLERVQSLTRNIFLGQMIQQEVFHLICFCLCFIEDSDLPTPSQQRHCSAVFTQVGVD